MNHTDSDSGSEGGGTRRRVHRRDSADRTGTPVDRERNRDRDRDRDGRRRDRESRGRDAVRGRDWDAPGATAADPAVRLQRTAGNRAVRRAVRWRREQRTDAHEPRADAHEQRTDAHGAEGAPEASPPFPSGAGKPLPEETRTLFEGRFGRSFEDVRVHAGPGAASVTRALGADAVTRGSDVYFGAGRYRPGGAAGRGLLAHELAHAVQQPDRTGAAAHSGARVTVPGDPLERRARTATRRIAAGRAVDASALGTAAKPVVARQATGQSTVPVGPTRPTQSGREGGGPDGGGRRDGVGSESGGGPGGAAADRNRLDLQGSGSVDAAAIAERLPEGETSGSVPVRFGTVASGTIEVHEEADGTYSTSGRESIRFTHPALDPVERQQGVAPVLRVGLDSNALSGFVSLSGAEFAEDSSKALVDWVAANPALMGWTGLDQVAFPSVENTIEGGQLTLLASGFTFRLGGFADGSGEFGLAGETVVFSADATVAVEGLTETALTLRRTESGALTGSVRVPVAYEQFEGEVFASFGNGTVSMEGTAAYAGEKFGGTVTLLVTDAETATQVARRQLGPDAVRSSAEETAGEETEPGREPAAGPKPGPRALAGYGTLEVNLTEWLAGTADVVVDGNGEVTVVGEVAPPAEITLFEQEDFVYEFPRVEVTAIYGVPVVGNLNVFANVGVDAIAKLGPGTLYDIALEGTYSTDPDVYQDYSLAATMNVSAFAGVRLRAEGGAGVTIVAHDLKAGVGIEGTAGVRGYVEARPTIGYREVADPSRGKAGQFFIAGHMEIAARPAVGLAGDLFVELDSPWASPAPDETWTWPIGELEYPLPGEFGIGADVDYVLGSGEAPDVEFGEVDFDSEKFMTDLMNDDVPRGAGAPKRTEGQFTDEGKADSRPSVGKERSSGSGSVKKPPTKRGGGSKRRPGDRATGRQGGRGDDVPAPGVEKRWQGGMRALMDLSNRSRDDALTRAELKAELARIDRRYRFSTLRVAAAGSDWEVRAAMNPDETFTVEAAGDERPENDRETDETAAEERLTERDVDGMVESDLPRRGGLPDWAQRGAILVGGVATALAVLLGAAPPGAGRFQSEALRREESRSQAVSLPEPAAASAEPPSSSTPDLVAFEALVAERRQELEGEFDAERGAIDARAREVRDRVGTLESRIWAVEAFRRRATRGYEARLDAINEARERRFQKLERGSDGPLDETTRKRVNAGYDRELDSVKASMDEIASETAAERGELESRILELKRTLERLTEQRREVDAREQSVLETFAATVARRREQVKARGGRYTGSSVVSGGAASGEGGTGGARRSAGTRTGTGGEARRTAGSGAGVGSGSRGRQRDRRERDRSSESADARERSSGGRETARGSGDGTGAGEAGGFGGEGGPTTAEEAFGGLGEELGLESEAPEPTGTVAERTRESVRLAREAGWIDEEGRPVRDESGRAVGPGAAAQPHARAGAVREELGVSGTGDRAKESAHVVPQAFVEQLPGYSTGQAKTVLMPKGVHASLDSTWKEWAKRERRAGETTTTVRDAYRALVRAIHSTSALSADEQGALQQVLDQELFSEQGLDPDRELALPYPNLTPGESGSRSRSPERAARYPEVEDELLGERADAVPESTLKRLGYYRKPNATPTQIVRRRADDAVYPKLTVEEETGDIVLAD